MLSLDLLFREFKNALPDDASNCSALLYTSSLPWCTKIKYSSSLRPAEDVPMVSQRKWMGPLNFFSQRVFLPDEPESILVGPILQNTGRTSGVGADVVGMGEVVGSSVGMRLGAGVAGHIASLARSNDGMSHSVSGSAPSGHPQSTNLNSKVPP